MKNQWQRCCSKVLIVSPSYGNTDFRCDVIADANLLAVWAKKHAEGVYGGGKEVQEAREKLPNWLLAADSRNESISTISMPCNAVLKPYTLDLVEMGIAQLFCPDCNAVDESPQLLEYEGPVRAYEANWISEWRCSKGHLLYYAEHHWLVN